MSNAELIRITSPQQADLVAQRALADDHAFAFATHAVIKDGDIAGAWSLGAVPLVLVWHDRKRMGAADSLSIHKQVQAVMRDRGTPVYMVPCNPDSPLHPYMQRVGFQNPYRNDLFIMKG